MSINVLFAFHLRFYKMANRTQKDVQTIKGTNPQFLVEKIIRLRVYDCKYWKEECFGLTGMRYRLDRGGRSGSVGCQCLSVGIRRDVVISALSRSLIESTCSPGCVVLCR